MGARRLRGQPGAGRLDRARCHRLAHGMRTRALGWHGDVERVERLHRRCHRVRASRRGRGDGGTPVMTTDLAVFSDPTSVAVVGASDDPAKWGYWLAYGALQAGHRRRISFVNSRSTSVLGH